MCSFKDSISVSCFLMVSLAWFGWASRSSICLSLLSDLSLNLSTSRLVCYNRVQLGFNFAILLLIKLYQWPIMANILLIKLLYMLYLPLLWLNLKQGRLIFILQFIVSSFNTSELHFMRCFYSCNSLGFLPFTLFLIVSSILVSPFFSNE